MDYVTRQFINLTKKFRKESRKALSELLRAIHQQTEAIRKTTERDHEQQEPERPPVIVRAELHVPENVERDRKTHEDRQHSLQIFVVVGTWAAFLAATGYAYIALRQWRETIAARHQVERSIDEAKRAADTAHEALVSVQRAFISLIGFEGWDDTDPNDRTKMIGILLYPSWKNTGTTPGTWATQRDNRLTSRLPIPDGFSFPDYIEDWVPTGQTAHQVPAGQAKNLIPMYYPPQATVNASLVSFSKQEIDELFNHRLHLYVYGWTRYHDIFQGTPEHITMFCYEITGVSVFTAVPVNPAQNSVTTTFSMCAHHNCVDDQCKNEPGY